MNWLYFGRQKSKVKVTAALCSCHACECGWLFQELCYSLHEARCISRTVRTLIRFRKFKVIVIVIVTLNSSGPFLSQYVGKISREFLLIWTQVWIDLSFEVKGQTLLQPYVSLMHYLKSALRDFCHIWQKLKLGQWLHFGGQRSGSVWKGKILWAHYPKNALSDFFCQIWNKHTLGLGVLIKFWRSELTVVLLLWSDQWRWATQTLWL